MSGSWSKRRFLCGDKNDIPDPFLFIIIFYFLLFLNTWRVNEWICKTRCNDCEPGEDGDLKKTKTRCVLNLRRCMNYDLRFIHWIRSKNKRFVSYKVDKDFQIDECKNRNPGVAEINEIRALYESSKKFFVFKASYFSLITLVSGKEKVLIMIMRWMIMIII